MVDDSRQCFCVTGSRALCVEADFALALPDEFGVVDLHDGGFLDLASCHDLPQEQDIQGRVYHLHRREPFLY